MKATPDILEGPIGTNSLRKADNFLSDEGLAKNGSTMSQIPTYVTAVPNGTEKVRAAFPRVVEAH